MPRDTNNEQHTEAKLQKVIGILIGAAATALMAVLLTANAQRTARSALLQPPPPPATVTVPAEQPDNAAKSEEDAEGWSQAGDQPAQPAHSPSRKQSTAPNPTPAPKITAPRGTVIPSRPAATTPTATTPSPSLCAYSTDRTTILTRGNTGPAVRQAQCLLNTALGQHLALDADFGIATDQAVRQLQTCARISVDGKIGPVTWQALTTPPPTCRTS